MVVQIIVCDRLVWSGELVPSLGDTNPLPRSPQYAQMTRARPATPTALSLTKPHHSAYSLSRRCLRHLLGSYPLIILLRDPCNELFWLWTILSWQCYKIEIPTWNVFSPDVIITIFLNYEWLDIFSQLGNLSWVSGESKRICGICGASGNGRLCNSPRKHLIGNHFLQTTTHKLSLLSWWPNPSLSECYSSWPPVCHTPV